MAWTLISDTTFSGATSTASPGALGTLYNGWIDESGTWSVDGSGILRTAYTGAWTNMNSGVLYRPATEKSLNTQVVMRFTYVAGALPNIILSFNRATGNPPFSSGEGVGLGTSVNQIFWGRWNATAGTYNGVNNGTTFTALTAGNTYDLAVQFVQNAGATGRTISGALYNVTTPATDALMSGSTFGAWSVGGTITTPGLNYTDCVPGVFVSTGPLTGSGNSTVPANGAGAANAAILRIATYNDAGGIPMTLQEASGLTFTGPSSATVGTASTNYTVTPTTITFAFNTTVTPTDHGKGGTFTPGSLSFTAAVATGQTFTYTPATAAGSPYPIDLTAAASNPTSVMPAAIPLTVTGSSPATAFALTGPTSGATGVASTNFSITPDGTPTGSMTVSVTAPDGTFSPTFPFTFTTSTAQTFTYTPATSGAKTLTMTNSGGLTNTGSPFTYTAASVATQFTLSGPTSGVSGSASSNFSITPNAAPASSTTVSVTATDGTFSPTFPLTFTTSTAQTFTYTPASAGAKTLTMTNSASLTNVGSPFAYTATSPSTGAIAPNHPAFLWSPYNWNGLGTSRSNSSGSPAYIETCQSGAWFEFTWTAGASPTATIDFPVRTVTNTFTAFVNGARVANRVTVPSGAYTLTGITASAVNTLKFFINGSSQASGWLTTTNTVRIPSITIDAGSTAGTARALRSWVLMFADSIGEGIYAGAGSVNDNLSEWSYLFGQSLNALGYDYSISAFGSNGWRALGWSSDVPALYLVTSGAYNTTNSGASSSRWHLVANGISGLDANNHMSAQGATGTEPFAVLNFMGTNDQTDFTAVSSDLNISIRGNGSTIPGFWGAIRAAAPNAWMMQFSTFCSYNPAVTSAGAAIRTLYTALAADRVSDTKFAYLDTGIGLTQTLTCNTDGTTGGGNGVFLATGNGSHPNTAGAALIAPAVSALFNKTVNAGTGGTQLATRCAHF